MSLSPEQYIALSAAAYGDYSNDDKNQKIDRIRKKIQNNELECSNLGSLSFSTSSPLPPVSALLLFKTLKQAR